MSDGQRPYGQWNRYALRTVHCPFTVRLTVVTILFIMSSGRWSVRTTRQLWRRYIVCVNPLMSGPESDRVFS